MASIDERIVAMSFENTRFEAGVATTMGSLNKLNRVIADIGKVNGLSQIEASANKVNFAAPMSALDKLKAKLGFSTAPKAFSDLENASVKTQFKGPQSALDKLKSKLGFQTAPQAFTNLETASSKARFAGPSSALDRLKAKLGFSTAPKEFANLEGASTRAQFKAPQSALDRLKGKLGFPSAPRAFGALEAESSRVSFQGIHRAVDGVTAKFGAMKIAGVAAFATIVAQATAKTGAWLKSFTLDPIIGGFKEYGTNLQSIQTILANTSDSGGNLKTVQSALQQLNKYSDQTIFNFGEMARNIGTFTAAGVHLQPAVSAIKGIANLAALSGSNSQQASTAMYQLSQAIAAGRVGLQDWNSVVNAGMGGAVFQKALIRTGQNMGTIAKGAVNIDKATGKATISGKSFRESIQASPGKKSWLTSDVLTKTLAQFTGDLSNAQLHAQGFSDAQIKAIQLTAKNAKLAATQVKSLPQVFDVAKETIGSGWATTFQTIFGNFTQARSTFTSLSNTINAFINANARARNRVLKDWAALGGRTVLIQGIKNAFTALKDVIKPIHDAFRDIFPAATGKTLFDLTVKFRDLMKHLQASPVVMENLKRTFRGLFAVLHIVFTVVKDVAKGFFSLIGAAGKGSGGILAFTGSIGDFLTALDHALTRGGSLTAFFHSLGTVLKVPMQMLKGVGHAIASLFSGSDAGGGSKLSGTVDTVRKAFAPLSGVLNAVSKAWRGFVNILGKVKTAVTPFLTDVAHVIGNFGNVVADALRNADYSKVFAAINTVLIGGIFLTLKKAFGGGVGVKFDFGGGVLKQLSSTFAALTGNLQAMQKNIQAHTLLAIAAGIFLLAGGVALLSTINPKKLTTALTAVAVGMGEMIAALILLRAASVGGASLLLIAGSIILLASAMVILASAMKILATMSWNEIAKGLVGVAGALTAVALGTKLMEGPKLLVTAASLLPLAIAINVLAVAVKMFATMSWEQMAKGLVGVAGALAAIALGMAVMPPDMPLVGTGLIAISFGLSLLAGAVAAFGAIKPLKMAQGILGIGAALFVLGLALDTFPPTLVADAAALILIGVGLTVLSGAIGILGHMNIGTLVKGITAMGAALVVLAVGLEAMSGTLGGAAALLVASGAFVVLGTAMGLIGNLPWGVILKALAAMALSLGVLAVVGAVAAAPLIALAAALALLGIGLLAVGAAVYLFGAGISLMSDKTVSSLAKLTAAAGAFLLVFPAMFVKFITGIVTVLEQVVQLAPRIISALVNIAGQLLVAFTQLVPKIAVAVGVLITGILTVLNNNAGPIIRAGYKLVLNLLSGIASNIGKVTDKAVQIVTRFVEALGRNAPRLIGSGARTLLIFLNGITSKIPSLVATVAKLITVFITNVARRIPQIVAAGAKLIVNFLNAIAHRLPGVIAAGVNMIVAFLKGVGNGIPRIVRAAVTVAAKFINALSNGLVRLVNVGFNAIIRFMNGLATAIRRNSGRLFNAGWNIASAIIDGIFNGLTHLAGKVIGKIGELAHKMLDKVTSIFDIGSPSKVMMEIGNNVLLGLAVGLDRSASTAENSMAAAGNRVLDKAKTTFSNVPGMLEGIMDMEPVITPVLDLSNVRKEAGKLGDVIQTPAFDASISSDQAAFIAARNKRKAAEAAAVQEAVGTTVNFEQNNYSPDPLSNIEIYRQTRNQLTRLKSQVA